MAAPASHVLTIVGPEPGALTDAIVAEARQALNGLGARTEAPDWLADERAVDVPFTDADADQAARAVRGVIDGRRLDIWAGRQANRRKKLLVADMDATIVTSETLDDLAAHAGHKDTIAAITAKAMNGELNFEDAIKERVAMLAGLSEDMLAATYAEIALTGGAVELVRTMRAGGAYCVLVSGGFTYFTARVGAACGFHEDHANRFEIEDGRLTGRVIEPILGKEKKLATLQRLVAERGLDSADSVAIGDGANDLPMIEAAGLGVAFHGKPVVAAAAPARIEHGDLTTLLFYQGYREADFTRT